MNKAPVRASYTAILCSVFLPLAAPAAAQTESSAHLEMAASLDLLVDASSSLDSSLALARQQTDSGALLGAVTTLERLLLDFPESASAMALHATLLCRLDDVTGGKAELDILKARGTDPAILVEGEASCAEAEAAGPAVAL